MLSIYLDSHTSADKFATSLHSASIASSCQTNFGKSTYCVSTLGRIKDKGALAKVLKRYDKHIIEIISNDIMSRHL